MIKRIFNWSFGAFFRTIGRTLAYLAIVLILLFIGSKLNLFNTMIVNAADEFSYTNANWAFHECNWDGSETSNCKWTSTAAIGTNIYRDDDYYIDGFRINLNYSGTTLVSGNSYTLTFNMAVSTPHYFANLASPLAFVETRDSCIGASSSATDCLYENFTSFSIKPTYSGSGNVVKFTINFVPTQNSNYVKIFLIQTNNTYNMLQPNDIDLIEETTYGRIGSISGTYVSGTSAIIENQTNVIQNQTDTIINQNTQINDNITNIQDSINDSNVDGANDVASSFFNNFDTEDHGGLSSIVRAPLNAVNSMLTGTCEPMTATFKGKTLSLPCGDILWNRPNADGLKAFINLVFGGPIAYGILIGFYKMIERLKNPDDDRVDVMSL